MALLGAFCNPSMSSPARGVSTSPYACFRTGVSIVLLRHSQSQQAMRTPSKARRRPTYRKLGYRVTLRRESVEDRVWYRWSLDHSGPMPRTNRDLSRGNASQSMTGRSSGRGTWAGCANLTRRLRILCSKVQNDPGPNRGPPDLETAGVCARPGAGSPCPNSSSAGGWVGGRPTGEATLSARGRPACQRFKDYA
jgi:hypothetical protein